MPFPSVPSPPALFPTYLVSSLAFRRRKSSADSSCSWPTTRSDSIDSALSASPPSNGVSNNTNNEPFLAGHGSHLRCARCAADLAHASQIISKGFTGRHGRAYLVAAAAEGSDDAAAAGGASSAAPHTLTGRHHQPAALPNLPNTHVHKAVPRTLVTGAHTVGDISCAHCGSVLGWKYVAAEEEAQRYKVGKFILETKRVCRSSTWDGEEEGEGEEGVGHRRRGLPPSELPRLSAGSHPGEVEFDSQDEDECEDLFLGVWTPQLAAKRRRQKRFDRIDED